MIQHTKSIPVYRVLFCLIFTSCGFIGVSQKKIPVTAENTLQLCEHAEETTQWIVQGFAHDQKDKKYYIHASRDFVIYIHPFTEIVYSRNGDVIGFIDKTHSNIHLHNPEGGWGPLHIGNVGIIKNPYEGIHLPDFSHYKTPATKVTRDAAK